MSAAIQLAVDSDLSHVALVARAVRAICADFLDAEAADAVELSLVEAINNVIKHGYEGKPGKDVGVLVSLQKDRVTIEVVDRALPIEAAVFERSSDPFAFDETNLDDVPEGGMGLALIRMSMDEVEYMSRDGENRLRMTKLIPPRG
jgi:serine/threonine-protein kinase RsbW